MADFMEELKDSFEKGAEKFKDDMEFTKKSYEEVVAEDKAERAARKIERKEDREDFAQGMKEFIEKSGESLEEAAEIAEGKDVK